MGYRSIWSRIQTVFVLLVCAQLPVFAIGSAEVIVTLNDGNTLTWNSYTEKPNEYCTLRHGGEICISKKDVVSVTQKKNEYSENVIVVPSRDEPESVQSGTRNSNKSPEIVELEKQRKLRDKKEKTASYEYLLRSEALWAECGKRKRENPSRELQIAQECLKREKELADQMFKAIDR